MSETVIDFFFGIGTGLAVVAYLAKSWAMRTPKAKTSEDLTEDDALVELPDLEPETPLDDPVKTEEDE